MGYVIYSWPEQLSECWWIPMERSGFTVQRLHHGGIVKYSGATVRVVVGEDGAAAIQGWSFPWTRRRKLGCAVERILLASGMQAFCKPHSTNLIYQVRQQPNHSWVESLDPGNIRICFAPHTGEDGSERNYPCGSFTAGAKSIRFWTGPAINSESKTLIHYIALGADAALLGLKPGGQFPDALDSILIAKGARRIDVQRILDR